MFDEIKRNLFTIPGVIITLIHVFIAVGVITSWIFFQVQIMGNDPLAVIQQPTKAQKR